MFSHKHYVPILRWKRAEMAALRELLPQDRLYVTPLVELVPRNFTRLRKGRLPNPADVLERMVAEVLHDWGPGTLFVDLWLLDPLPRVPDGTHPISLVLRRGREAGLGIVPVVGLRSDPRYVAAVADSSTLSPAMGACVRVRPPDLECRDLRARIRDALNNLHLEPGRADLLVDLGLWDAPRVPNISDQIPALDEWRSFTLTSGAFPRDLGGFSVGQHLLQRSDWLTWRRYTEAATGTTRLPSFGDYTIQHPNFSEPPGRANFSASIRYATDDHWVIMRGEGVFHDGSPGFAQWPANAQLLCERAEFCGREYSYGDGYIYDMGSQALRTGSAETWLRAGINHHMTFAARQVASLP